MNYGTYPPPGGYPPPPVPGYPQAAPPQGFGGGYPQAAPPQGFGGGYPQAAPPQGFGGGYPQAAPPQGFGGGYPQAAPPQGFGGGYPQAVPPPIYTVPPNGYAPAYGPVFEVGGARRRPEDPRRKGASRTLNRMSFLVLAQTGLSFFWQVPLILLLSLVGVEIFSNSLGYQWLTAILVPLSTALPFVAYLFFTKKDLSDYLKFEKVGFVSGLLLVLAGWALILLGNYPAILVGNIFSFFGYESSSAYVSQANSLDAILLEIAVGSQNGLLIQTNLVHIM